MKNSTALAIIAIIIVIGAGAFLAVRTYQPREQQPSTEIASYTPDASYTPSVQEPLEYTQPMVYLEPQQNSVRVGNTVIYTVRVESDAQLAGIESQLRFNPSIVTVTKITPGALFTKPEILTNTIDTDTGVISYSLGTFTPVSARGEAFTITLTVKSMSNQPLLTFDRELTKVALLSATSAKPFTEAQTTVQFTEKQASVTN